jgi:hypothetical protein|nr:MAG TPA: hypothetical protein [Caudoviricetes sp.]
MPVKAVFAKFNPEFHIPKFFPKVELENFSEKGTFYVFPVGYIEDVLVSGLTTSLTIVFPLNAIEGSLESIVASPAFNFIELTIG